MYVLMLWSHISDPYSLTFSAIYTDDVSCWTGLVSGLFVSGTQGVYMLLLSFFFSVSLWTLLSAINVFHSFIHRLSFAFYRSVFCR